MNGRAGCAGLRAGDTVVVTAGAHRGRRGKLLATPRSWTEQVEVEVDTGEVRRQRVPITAWLVEPAAREDR